jgi:hypothetical protein
VYYRGHLSPELAAGDPQRIGDHATFAAPSSRSEGSITCW